MKKYEFHSSLPPETVFSRLAGWAKPPDLFAQGDGTFRYKRKKDSFWLGYTGTIPANGFIPFCGEVRPEGDGSVITGGFSVPRALWPVYAAAFGFVCLMMFVLDAPLEVTIIVPALWVMLCVKFFTWNQKVFFKKRQRAVLEFIERHLLE